jgi:hypothetical protein
MRARLEHRKPDALVALDEELLGLGDRNGTDTS